MVYIRLFHGRSDPKQDMDDWGIDGPIFGPLCFVHTTYTYHIKLGRENDHVDELFMFDDMVYYDGIYYGDWTVFDVQILKEGDYKVVEFNQVKANLPKAKMS